MKKIVLLLSMGLLLFSCHPEDNPSVSTGEVTNITATTATCAGNVFADGGAAIIARGICWSTSQFPTISDSKTSNGNGLGIFTSNITSLSPNTTYYVRAYATNSVGTAYGEQKTFTTNVEQTLPTVTTGDISNITTTTADCSGNVTSDGGSSVTARGVCWSTSENPTTSDSKTTNGTGLGTYTSNITGISPNTTYYVRAYATNAKGTAYGEQKTFTTNAEQTTPTVTTGEITNITPTTADCSGNVTSEGGSSVTTRGVCWSTSENPTTSDSKTTDGTGVGTYTSNITGLFPNTTYYVRAYATNDKGTAYGQQLSFVTQEEQGPTFGSLTDTRDGKAYKTVTIGNQTWMAENLAYLPSVVGPETGSEEGRETDPFYYVYGYDGTNVAAAKATTNYQTYGVLYNWHAALPACPPGWHLPSDAEWTKLENYLISNGYNYDGTTTDNKIALSLSATGWDYSSYTGTPGYTDYSEFRNKSGFSALPGGYRNDDDGDFHFIGGRGVWWSSTRISVLDLAYYRQLENQDRNVIRDATIELEGFSVRCVMNTAEQTTPTVTTGNVTNITPLTVRCSGDVTSDGGLSIIARGVCWSTSENPTTSNSKTTDGTDVGTYTSNITGLSPNTKYYARAYATNAKGTSYGQQRSFVTKEEQDPVFGSLSDSRDGKVYKTVSIGEQVWMAENLAYLPSVMSMSIQSNTIPYNYVYGYDGTDVAEAKATEEYKTYGVLYNWPSAMDRAASSDKIPSGVQGICPDGWHLPSDDEWTQLENYLIAYGYNYDGTTEGNKIAKSMASASGWNVSNEEGTPGNTDYTHYINRSGFSALPGGYRASGGSFFDIGYDGNWWSSTEDDDEEPWYRELSYNDSNIFRYSSPKRRGFSVRCVQDKD